MNNNELAAAEWLQWKADARNEFGAVTFRKVDEGGTRKVWLAFDAAGREVESYWRPAQYIHR